MEYEDYIHESNGKWYLHKEYERLLLKDLNWFLADNTGISNINTHRWAVNHPSVRITNNNMETTRCNILPSGTANTTWGQDRMTIGQSKSQLVIRMPATLDTAEKIITELTNKNAYAYALVNAPTDTEITYEPLIEQLNAIKDARLYDGITNIIIEGNLPVIFSGKTYTTESTELTIENEGNIYARPKLTLTGIADISIYLNGSQIFTLNLDREAPETIIIDCENMDAFYDGVLKNRKVTGDYSNFKLQPGNNQIAVSGSVAELKVETYSRWL